MAAGGSSYADTGRRTVRFKEVPAYTEACRA
jgi:hypothetical protein